MNGNGKPQVGWVQVVIACIATGASVFLVENAFVSTKVSVEAMNEFRKNEDDFRRTVERRLGFLEVQDQRISEKIDKHLESDRAEFGEIDKRVRDAEISLAKMSSRVKTSRSFKPIAPNLHEALKVKVPMMTSYERPRIGGIE